MSGPGFAGTERAAPSHRPFGKSPRGHAGRFWRRSSPNIRAKWSLTTAPPQPAALARARSWQGCKPARTVAAALPNGCSAMVPVVWTGSGKNKLRPVAGGKFHHSRNQTQPLLLLWRCEACGQPPTCGQGGGTARRFPRLVHRGPRLRGQAGIGAADGPQIHSVYAPSRYAAAAPAGTSLPK
jgi:hypothetical protein